VIPLNKNNTPKVLLWDVESSHNLLLAFELGNKDMYIPYENIITERHIFCISYKWLGEKKIHTISIVDDKKRFDKDINDDFYVVSEFRKILETADAQVYHYGTGFDTPMLQARMAFHNLAPLPKIITIDTKNVAKRNFKFNSNRLDYLAKHLGFKGKMKNPSSLWIKCFMGDKESLEHMAKYNRQDIEILEFVYTRLVPFLKNNPLNRNQFTSEAVCPHCGSTHLQSRGYSITRTAKYRRLQCQDCGSWSEDRKAVKTDIVIKVK